MNFRPAATGAMRAWRMLSVVAGGAALATALPVGAQSLTVLPVSLQLAPGQTAASLTVINSGSAETSIQVRALAWTQNGGEDQLTPADVILASPPLATIPAGGTQVVRLVLRRPPVGKEETYRILLDQIPPAGSAGTVRLALRLSIPVFAEPKTRTASHMTFSSENSGGGTTLVALNDGNRHETLRDIAMKSDTGLILKTGNGASPYVLAGSTRRWKVVTLADEATPAVPVRVTAHADLAVIDRPVTVARP